MGNSPRRVPVYRQVQQQPQSDGPSDQHNVIVSLNDGLHPYVPARNDAGQSAPAISQAMPQAVSTHQSMRQAPQQPQQDPPAEGEFDLFRKVMFALRGRWLLAIGLAIISGAA